MQYTCFVWVNHLSTEIFEMGMRGAKNIIISDCESDEHCVFSAFRKTVEIPNI